MTHHLIERELNLEVLKTEVERLFGYQEYVIFHYDSMEQNAQCVEGIIEDQEKLL